MATFLEIATESSMRNWSDEGPNRLIKVVNSANYQKVEQYNSVMGYVTQEKYLYGKTSLEIERLLGLRPGELKRGAWIYAMVRKPKLGEFEFKFSTAMPDGEIFDDVQFKKILDARKDYLAGKNLYARAHNAVAQYYPPGSPMIPQWEITTPVPLKGLVAIVLEHLPFQRPSGSVNPYRPHNRSEIS